MSEETNHKKQLYRAVSMGMSVIFGLLLLLFLAGSNLWESLMWIAASATMITGGVLTFQGKRAGPLVSAPIMTAFLSFVYLKAPADMQDVFPALAGYGIVMIGLGVAGTFGARPSSSSEESASSFFRWYFRPMSLEGAQKACKISGRLIIGIGVLISAFPWAITGHISLNQVTCTLAVASLGIHVTQGNRLAAIAAVAFVSFGVWTICSIDSHPWGTVIRVLPLLIPLFVLTLRGTFSWHRYQSSGASS